MPIFRLEGVASARILGENLYEYQSITLTNEQYDSLDEDLKGYLRPVDIGASEPVAETVKWAVFDSNASGPLVPVVAGKAIEVRHLLVQKQADNATVVSASFNDSETNTLIASAPKVWMKDGGDGVFCASKGGLFRSTSGQGIDVVLSASVQVFIQVGYVEV